MKRPLVFKKAQSSNNERSAGLFGLAALGAQRRQWVDYTTFCLNGKHYRDERFTTIPQRPGTVLIATGCAYEVQESGAYRKMTLEEAGVPSGARSQIREPYPKQKNKFA